MAWHKALQEIRNRSFEKTYREQFARQKKTDDEKKEHLKKQTQDSQFLALLFSIRRFQQERFFLKARLEKLKNNLSAARKRKRRLALSKQLSDIQDTLSDYKEKKKQTEEHSHPHSHFHSSIKPITPFKNILEERSASLKNQKEFPLHAKQLKFWE